MRSMYASLLSSVGTRRACTQVQANSCAAGRTWRYCVVVLTAASGVRAKNCRCDRNMEAAIAPPAVSVLPTPKPLLPAPPAMPPATPPAAPAAAEAPAVDAMLAATLAATLPATEAVTVAAAVTATVDAVTAVTDVESVLRAPFW